MIEPTVQNNNEVPISSPSSSEMPDSPISANTNDSFDEEVGRILIDSEQIVVDADNIKIESDQIVYEAEQLVDYSDSEDSLDEFIVREEDYDDSSDATFKCSSETSSSSSDTMSNCSDSTIVPERVLDDDWVPKKPRMDPVNYTEDSSSLEDAEIRTDDEYDYDDDD